MHYNNNYFDSDEDDVPLNALKSDGCSDDLNSYDSLCVPTREPCELCDRVSHNRYTSIIHNVKHIIIPLINIKTYQCEVCLHHFTSETDLLSHKAKKHSLYDLVSHTNLVNDSYNSPNDETYDNDLITIVKQEKTSPVKQINTFNEAYHNGINDTSYKLTGESQSNDSYNTGGSSLKSRLIFEDDEDDIICTTDNLLTDLTTDCEVYVDLFPTIWESEEKKSVHYEELIKPGVFRCKKCVRNFPTKYEAIIHEANHIFIKNSQINYCNICKEYIQGDYRQLKHHKLTSHHSAFQLKSNGIKDNLTADFGAKIEQNGCQKEPYVTNTVTMKLCDVCFAFCRNKSFLDYEFIEQLSQVSKNFKCDKCLNTFSDINLVKRKTTFKNSWFSKPKKFGGKTVGKNLSNEARLKSICKRLKKLKKIYIVVLL